MIWNLSGQLYFHHTFLTVYIFFRSFWIIYYFDRNNKHLIDKRTEHNEIKFQIRLHFGYILF